MIEEILIIAIIIIFCALISALIVLIGFALIQSTGRIIESEIIAKMIKKYAQDRRWK